MSSAADKLIAANKLIASLEELMAHVAAIRTKPEDWPYEPTQRGWRRANNKQDEEHIEKAHWLTDQDLIQNPFDGVRQLKDGKFA